MVEWCFASKESVWLEPPKRIGGEKNTNADTMNRSKLSIFIALQVEVSSQSSLKIADLRTRVANQRILGE